MGFFGLGLILILFKLCYGSFEVCVFIEEVVWEMVLVGWEVVLELVREKGFVLILVQDYEVIVEMFCKCLEMVVDGYKVGDCICGSVFYVKYFCYMQWVVEYVLELIEVLVEIGVCFIYYSFIVLIGIISLSLVNNVFNGIELSFVYYYLCNLICEGCKIKEKVEVYSYELLVYWILVNVQVLLDSDDLV